MNQKLAEGRGDEAAENDRGDRIENLPARFLPAQDERDEPDPRGQSRHQHGGEPFQTAADHHAVGECFPPLLLHEVEVVRDEQDSVADRDASERDETDEAGDRQILPRNNPERERRR